MILPQYFLMQTWLQAAAWTSVRGNALITKWQVGVIFLTFVVSLVILVAGSPSLIALK